jgi:hypothetical protein
MESVQSSVIPGRASCFGNRGYRTSLFFVLMAARDFVPFLVLVKTPKKIPR